MVVKVTVVVGDNKQTNKQTLSSSFFLFCFFTFFWRQTKRETFFRVVEETKILGGKRSLGRLFELSDVELSSTLTHRKLHFLTHTNTHTHTHTHTQCSLYNPKSPAPRSSPKLSPRSNNDPPSSRRRWPTAKVRFRGENNFSRKKRTDPQILSLDG